MTTDHERLRVVTAGQLTVGATVDLALRYTTGHRGFRPGGNLWLFYDIRQYTQQRTQHLLPDDGLVVSGPAGTTWSGAMLAEGRVVRTLDTIPQLPEFLYGLHVTCTGRELGPGETVTLRLRSQPEGFALPQNAIDAFHFWLVEDPTGALRFEHAPGEKYHYYQPRDARLSVLQSNPLTIAAGAATNIRVHCPSLSTGRTTARLRAEDAYGNPARLPNRPLAGQSCTTPGTIRAALDLPLTVASSAERKTLPSPSRARAQDVELAVGGRVRHGDRDRSEQLPQPQQPGMRMSDAPAQPQLFWGELHGMAFNQRPYREYFEWAKEVACLDFAAGEYFSYNACVQETWDMLIEVWDAFEQPGTFISLPAVEYGTPPDISHRIAFYPATRGLPPILCEERKAAHDPNLTARYSPETIFCADYLALYDLVRRHNGLLHGHFHTQFYAGEDLAEIYQKQPSDLVAEERKINRALQAGLKLGIVGGSDTHDFPTDKPLSRTGTGTPGRHHGCLGRPPGSAVAVRGPPPAALLRDDRRAPARRLPRQWAAHGRDRPRRTATGCGWKHSAPPTSAASSYWRTVSCGAHSSHAGSTQSSRTSGPPQRTTHQASTTATPASSKPTASAPGPAPSGLTASA